MAFRIKEEESSVSGRSARREGDRVRVVELRRLHRREVESGDARHPRKGTHSGSDLMIHSVMVPPDPD